MKKYIFILRGLPGSGKTTAGDALADEGWPVFSADNYFIKDGTYKWDPKKIGAAHKDCQMKARLAMEKGVRKIFIANTNTTKKELKPYYEMAKDNGYQVFSLIVENRHEGVNIHNVPNDTLEKMASRFDVSL